MSNYLKPQNPLYHKTEDAYFYPLTTSDQVIVSNGERLNTLFKKTIRESVILQAANWSATQPYTQTITLSEDIDDYRVDANVVYGSDDDSALNKAAGCLTYIEKSHNEITFYCLKDKPEIDIPIEITGTCRNTIANITIEEGIKLNFEVVGGTTEPANPTENMIWVNTENEITGWYFSITQPENMAEGEVWFYTGSSKVVFNALKKNILNVYLISAKQQVSGTLVDMETKIYQDGEWKDFNLTLFDNGQTVPWISDSKSTTSCEVTIGNTIVFTYYDPNGGYSVAGTASSQDLSKYSTLYFDMAVSEHYDYYGAGAIVGVTSNVPTTGNSANNFTASKNPTVDGVRRTVDVDISSVNSGYITIHGIMSATIYRVWCE